jgi:hypothetical protein
MSDTRFIEDGHEWRRYMPAELEMIAKAAGVEKFGPIAVEKLQHAVEAYQWACEADRGGVFFSSYREQRGRLNEILKLCAPSAPEEKIRKSLNGLDGPTSQRLGPVGTHDRQRLARAVRRAIQEIPDSGPDPKRARRQFVADLYRIYYRVTRTRPGRTVHDGESGRFRDFVKAALDPFKQTMGCAADITAVLRRLKRAQSSKK